ncbi:type II secretion system protein, partial [bacterium]|nr:type II secretion system protein [bacterium]
MKRWNRNERKFYSAFTLAEVLITMAVICVVAAVTVPALLINIQERTQKEQTRNAKYKLTKATDKMKSLGLLGVQYSSNDTDVNTTENFVKELQKHLKIMKVCDNDHLSECWPTSEITLPTGTTSSGTVNNLKTGATLKALALGTKNTKTMGIVTADGTPMILVYSPKCTPLESERTYSWSTVDNKPETNATTNCISAIMDVNGKKGPNRLGKDVRTLNSLYGSVEFAAGYTGITSSECNSLKSKLGINGCSSNDDRWAAGVKKCHELGLHLPSEQTLAVAAGARYGRSDITPTTVIASDYWAMNNSSFTNYGSTCKERMERYYGANPAICIPSTSNNMGQDDSNAAITLDGLYWSSVEVSSSQA